MWSQDESSKYLYLLFKDFMHKEKVSETDKDWLYGQITFARVIKIISDNECAMMTDAINERKANM